MNNACGWQVVGLDEREWPECYYADNILKKGHLWWVGIWGNLEMWGMDD